MAAIYAADIFCDDCAEDIRNTIWLENTDSSDERTRDEWEADCGFDDERNYDSGEYPKYCSDDAESDSPQHCGSHEECINGGELSDGFKYGYCFGNSLTTDGEDYVKEAVRDGEEGGVAREVWAAEYDYLDFEDEEDCDEDA